jgi:hypothetical protein
MSLIRYAKLLKTLLFFGVFLALTTTGFSKSEYKYSYIPKLVFENQIFPVTVICISKCTKETPNFNFDKGGEIEPLSYKPLTVRNGDDSFYTFYFKAKKSDIKIPTLHIGSNNSSIKLRSNIVKLGVLEKRDDFSSVLAADMKIDIAQVSNYDEKNHLVTLSIEALEANLEDMKLNNVIEFGVEHLTRENAKTRAEFYFVVPASKKSIKFTYYNTIKKQYSYFLIPIKLADTTVVAQTDLNPKEDSFDLLKKYLFIFLLIFFVVMSLLKKDIFYLVFAVITLITLLTFYIPHKKICVKQGSSLYILPTSTSTISTKIDKKTQTDLLGQHEKYKKIEYKKGIIGWIKDEDICKD